MNKVNCNSCVNVNLTEEQQHAYYHSSEPYYLIPHFCKIYGYRLSHRSNKLKFHPMLYPCTKCSEDGHKNYKERTDELCKKEIFGIFRG
jgi:hypothetical protein